MADGIALTQSGAIATIRLDRPEAGNAIDLPMARALQSAAEACADDRTIRCVTLTGTGRMFCVGGDIASFASAGDDLPAFLAALTAPLHSAISRLMRMDKPLLTIVNGPAAGAGIGLAIMGDIAIAARSAHFTTAYTAIGFSPDAAVSWLLPRLIGLRRAQDLCLTNRRVSAEEAAAIGLITRVVDDGQLAEVAAQKAAELASAATSALAATRKLLLASADNNLEAQMDLEGRTIAAQADSADGREGIAAFIQKRSPAYGWS
jgi:2-(1,2-epoxy-1,2-dihydrophenyl)acetyl-CoA isomerase